jgi:hypothetical protein
MPQLGEAYEAWAHLKAAAYALDPQLAEGRRAKLQALLDYAACMRSHGVPNFPDPTVDDEGMGFPPSRSRASIRARRSSRPRTVPAPIPR